MENNPIKVEETDEAWLRPHRWVAYRGDMDLDLKVGTGDTPMEAIVDLFMQEGDE